MKLWYQSMSREQAWGDYNKALRRIIDSVKDPDIRERMTAQGLEAAGGTPRQYAVHLKEELAKYGRIAKAAGVRLD